MVRGPTTLSWTLETTTANRPRVTTAAPRSGLRPRWLPQPPPADWRRRGGRTSRCTVFVLLDEHGLVDVVDLANFRTVVLSGSAVSSASARTSRVRNGFCESMMNRSQLGLPRRFLNFWRSEVIEPFSCPSSSTKYHTAVDCGRPLRRSWTASRQRRLQEIPVTLGTWSRIPALFAPLVH